jgi:hypothetical protein
MKHLYLLLILFCWMAGCKKDAIDEYGERSYIYLANAAEDTSMMRPVEYSFAFNPGAGQDTVPLLVKLIGRLGDQDRPIAVTVDASQTTALTSDYTLPDPVLFRAGRPMDTIYLVLYNSDRLKTGKFKLRLVLNENEYFMPGPPNNSFVDVTFSDMIAKPDWWNDEVERNFLGVYSDTKYRLFIEATGISDMTDLSESEQRAYAVIFRDFLARGRENGEVYEDENGQINVSPNLF